MLIACFGDPGLSARREIADVPVVGQAQASFAAAAALGPCAVFTGGSSWGPMLLRFARSHRLDAQLVGVRTVEWTGAQMLDNVLLGARTVVDALASDRTCIAQPISAASPCSGLAPELARILG